MLTAHETYWKMMEQLEGYVRRHTDLDPASPFHGALLDSMPMAPSLPAWVHGMYAAAYGYVWLYEATRRPEHREMAIAACDYLTREQTVVGCWIGYQGFPSSLGLWNERNAPPGSLLRVAMPGAPLMDIIRGYIASLGPSWYAKVLLHASKVLQAEDSATAERYRKSFIAAAEFIYAISTAEGRIIIDPGVMADVWNKMAAPAALLYLAYRETGAERFRERADAITRRVLRGQFPSGEYPYAEASGHTLHYHFLTIWCLQDALAAGGGTLAKEIEAAIIRGLDWALGEMLQPDGSFDWSRHDPKDHKAQLSATAALAIGAAAPMLTRYEEPVERIVRRLAQLQRSDGGFPVHVTEAESDNVASGQVFHGLSTVAKHYAR